MSKLITRSVGFYERRVSMRAPDGRWVELPIPQTASFDDVVSGQAIFTLVERTHTSGADELRLVAAQDELVAPDCPFPAVQLR